MRVKPVVEADFRFVRPGRLVHGDLELVLSVTQPGDPVTGYVPCYHFEMKRTDTDVVLGAIRLRIGSARKLHYPGHIGYEVKEPYRGKHLAARSCKLILPIARAHGMPAVWITCDPKNIASQKSCLLAGARLVDTIRVPPSQRSRAGGSRYLRRYRIALT